MDLPNGILSQDTFGRVFARLEPEYFQRCFLAWLEGSREGVLGRFIALQGKTLQGSHDQPRGKSAIHLLSAWAAEHRLVLGQQQRGTSIDILKP